MGRFTNQAHAEDLILWHRFNYYVEGCALITDLEFDALERAVRAQWGVCICGIGGSVASDLASDYPAYIREGRRPLAHERVERDAIIASRWMANL